MGVGAAHVPSGVHTFETHSFATKHSRSDDASPLELLVELELLETIPLELDAPLLLDAPALVSGDEDLQA